MSNEKDLGNAGLKEELRSLLADALRVPIEKLTGKTSLSRDLGVDSLSILRAITIVENRYSIDLDEDQLDLLDNLDSAYRYVRALLEEKQ